MNGWRKKHLENKIAAEKKPNKKYLNHVRKAIQELF